MANTVSVTFEGDATGLDAAFDKVGKGAKEMADDLDKASDEAKKSARSLDDMSDGLGKTTTGLRGTNDLISGFSEVTGAALPPQAGLILGFADMADGLSTVLGPAVKAMQAGFWKLTAAMLSNPFIAIIALLIALGVGFVVLWKKSETFRKIVTGVWNAIKGGAQAMWKGITSAFDGIKRAIQGVWDKTEGFRSAVGAVASKIIGVYAGIGNGIKDAFRGAFNFVADAWNNTVGRLSFHIPGWVPGIGGNGFDVPDLPHFANGGRIRAGNGGGPVIVGENGPEMFVPGTSGMVLPTRALDGGGGGGNVTIVFEKSGDPLDELLLERLRKSVRVRGGTVQTVLGT